MQTSFLLFIIFILYNSDFILKYRKCELFTTLSSLFLPFTLHSYINLFNNGYTLEIKKIYILTSLPLFPSILTVLFVFVFLVFQRLSDLSTSLPIHSFSYQYKQHTRLVRFILCSVRDLIFPYIVFLLIPEAEKSIKHFNNINLHIYKFLQNWVMCWPYFLLHTSTSQWCTWFIQ